jgi:hypothetical protein
MGTPVRVPVTSSRSWIIPFALSCVLVIALASPSAAQDERTLKSFFEGKTVTVKIDMPATQQGIDVHPEYSPSVDFDSYSARIKNYGKAIWNGDQAMITKIKVKKDHIEFQLGGGGFGTFGDTLATSSVTSQFIPKSNRQKQLEAEFITTSDPARRAQIEAQIADEKDRRRREQQRADATTQVARQQAEVQVQEQRKGGGSRFNIHYHDHVPAALLTPAGLMRALSQWVEFPVAVFGPTSPDAEDATAPTPPPSTAFDENNSNGFLPIHKGMTEDDVIDVLGRPAERSESDAAGMKIVNATFKQAAITVEAQFVEGLLVKFTITNG